MSQSHSESLDMSPLPEGAASPKKNKERTAMHRSKDTPSATLPMAAKPPTTSSAKHKSLTRPLPPYRFPTDAESAHMLGKQEFQHGGHGGCSSASDEGWTKSISLISPRLMLPGSSDPSKLHQSMENVSLSSYVKLNLDMPMPSSLSLNYHDPKHLRAPPTNLQGNSGQPNHPGGGGGHMMMGRGAVVDYSPTPPRASVNMAAQFLIPGPTPGGILTFQDPPSFSSIGGPPGGPSSSSGPPSLNFFPQAPATAASTSPRQPPGPQPRIRKRAHDHDLNTSNDSDFPMMRDITFPSDSGCNAEGHEKGVEHGGIKPLLPPSSQGYSFTAGAGLEGTSSSTSQHLKWQAHMVSSWMDLCDGALQDIPRVGFQVDTDKGFNYSIIDDSFVCQKKNHFQVTVTVAFPIIPKFVKMKDGQIKPIEKFSIHLHGVKFDQINSEVKLEQSKSDRTKTKFEPEIIEVPSEQGQTMKRTLCRLHFSETTHNNMRKRGKPNPDQKYFSLVVALHADMANDSFPIVAHVSERIIVRASNPGNFDTDCDYSWFKSSNPEHIYHQGRVGINTDKPEEALSVHGNIQVTGQILQASDVRIKRNIRKVHSQHLDTISRLKLYEYQLADTLSSDKYGSCCDDGSKVTSGSCCGNGSEVTSSRSSSCCYTCGNPRLHPQNGYPDDNGGSSDSCSYRDGARCHANGCSCHGNKKPGGTRDEYTSKVNSMKSLSSPSSSSSSSSSTSHTPPVSSDVLHGRGGCVDESVPGEGGRKIMGLLAQEVREVIPNAVVETEQEVDLSDGNTVKNLLVVDKDQVLMAVLGSVQELQGITEGLQDRVALCEKGSKFNAGKPERSDSSTPSSLSVSIHKGQTQTPFLRQETGFTISVRATNLQWLALVIAFLLITLVINVYSSVAM